MGKHYLAIIHKDHDSDYGVCFPQFPGCIAAGKTQEEAIQQAAEALRFHISGMAVDQTTSLDPKSIEELKLDPSTSWVDWASGTIIRIKIA